MRLVLTTAGVSCVRLKLIKGVCDARRGCRAWDKPGYALCHLLRYLTSLMEKSNAALCSATRNTIYFAASFVAFGVLLKWKCQIQQ
eukprot:8776273-Pyramimonas_sp.AAC.1